MSTETAVTDDLARLKRGAKALGDIVQQQCLMVLDATQMHHVIEDDGDGDWGLVWERMAELCAKGLAAEKQAPR